MTITRDSITIKLTPEELRNAWEEQQSLYDLEDVSYFADVCNDNRRDQPYINMLAYPEFAKQVAGLYRAIQNDTSYDAWISDMSYAVTEIGNRVAQGKLVI